MAEQGRVGQGRTCLGRTGQQSRVGRGGARHVMAWPGWAGQDGAVQGSAGQGSAGLGKAGQARPGMAE